MIGHLKQLEKKPIIHPESDRAFMQVLVSETEGWSDHVMRVVTVEENGYTPKHAHPWPHINYMIEGEGSLMINGEITPIKAGSYAFVPGNVLHQFRNEGKTPFKFICIVPKEGHK